MASKEIKASNEIKQKKNVLQKDLSIKEVLAVLGVAGAIAMYGYLFIYPKYLDYKQSKNNLSAIESQISEYEDKINEMPKLQSQLDSLNSEIKIKGKILAHNMEDGMFLIGLSKVMNDFSVGLVNYSMEEPISYNEFYAIPTTVEVRGNYKNIREIIYYMETQKNMTQILDYSVETYIEEEEKDDNYNGAIVTDSIVYWTTGGTSYHKADCVVLKAEVNIGGELGSGTYSSSNKNLPCDVCKPYSSSSANTQIEDKEEPKSTGEVVANFNFIMYSSEKPTLNLNNDNSSQWKPGKWNPFTTTSR